MLVDAHNERSEEEDREAALAGVETEHEVQQVLEEVWQRHADSAWCVVLLREAADEEDQEDVHDGMVEATDTDATAVVLVQADQSWFEGFPPVSLTDPQQAVREVERLIEEIE